MMITQAQLEPLLARVQKPGRYVGGEWNATHKDWNTAAVRAVLAYPDLYEIGMSNLGLALLYDVVNAQPRMLAERVFCPASDMVSQMQDAGIPLYSLESRRSIDEYDVFGVSLQYELTYTNLLTMLDLANIPLLAADRREGHPLVIAGGSGSLNPEPLADFIDAFVVGEGEEVLVELLKRIAAGKQHGLERRGLLDSLASIEGVYIPSLYQPRYEGDVQMALEALNPAAPAVIRKRIVPTLPPVPTAPIVPTIEVIHDRAAIEISRGCSRGCRFCQAGMIYRPIRERSADEVLQAVEALIANTGHQEFALVSLSSSDHSHIQTLVETIMLRHPNLALSLPSLRIDSFSVGLAQALSRGRKTGFTFAPEAGSQRLRDVINKGVGEADLMRTAEAVFSQGWHKIKLYFMLGLPTETDEDVREIGRLVTELLAMGRRIAGVRTEINITASTFVPKPHTPFQWEPLIDREVLEERQALLRQSLPKRNIKFSWSDWDATWLEALFSRGDRRMRRVILRAWQLGARYDAWQEHFQPDLWHQAAQDCGVDADAFNHRRRGFEEHLPWEHIDVGVSRRFLQREYARSLTGELSRDCREECHSCGILAAYASELDQARGQMSAERPWGCP